MNEIIVTGRLCDDPKITTTKDMKAIAQFCLAVPDREYRLKDGNFDCDFVRVVIFNSKMAEVAEQWLCKGSEVLIKGKLKSSDYEKDGQKVYTTEIHASKLEFIGSLKDSDESESKKKK